MDVLAEQLLRSFAVATLNGDYEVRFVRVRYDQDPVVVALPYLDAVDQLAPFTARFLHEPAHDCTFATPRAGYALLYDVHGRERIRDLAQVRARLGQRLHQLRRREH